MSEIIERHITEKQYNKEIENEEIEKLIETKGSQIRIKDDEIEQLHEDIYELEGQIKELEKKIKHNNRH